MANVGEEITRALQTVTEAAVATTKSLITNVFNVKGYGALGDGTTDDSGAIQAAIDAAGLAGGGAVYIPAGTYRLVTALQLPGDKNVRVVGSGQEITTLACDAGFGNLSNTPVLTTTTAVLIEEGSLSFTASSTSGVVVGQLVLVHSTQDMPETAFVIDRTHAGIVTAVDAGTGVVTIDREFPIAFDTGNTVTITFYTVGKCGLGDLTVEGAYSGYFFDVTYSSGFTIKNVTVRNSLGTYQGIQADSNGMSAFRVMFAIDTCFEDCVFDHVHYGVMPTLGSVGCTMKECTAYRSRHIAAPTGGQQNFRGVNLTTYDCYAGLDSHQCSYDAYFVGCRTYSDEIENKFRGRYDSVDNCTLSSGVYLLHDAGIQALTSRDKFLKTMTNTTIGGSALCEGINVYIRTSRIAGQVISYVVTAGDSFTLLDSKLEYDGVLPYGSHYTAIWLAHHRRSIIRNVDIYGPYRGVDQTAGVLAATPIKAVLIERNNTGSGVVQVDNVYLDGFDYGFDFPLSLTLSRWAIRDITIRNCVIGIRNAANYKDNLLLDGITFSGCGTNSNESWRFRSPVLTTGVSDVNNRMVWQSAAPTTGTWKVGDSVYNTSPTAGGFIGWVCVTAGTPGTWKTFGAIVA